MIDQVRVQQILINLLSNALKFSPKGSTIFIKISQSEQDENLFTRYDIKVIDCGIGISEEDCSNLFKPFFQTKDRISRQLNQHGHGLGLNICKNLAKKLGYGLDVVSELGVGTTFRLTLNLHDVQETSGDQMHEIDIRFESY